MTNLVRWNPLRDNFLSLPNTLKDFFGHDHLSDAMTETLPAVNIKEEKDRYEITLAIPGVKKDECTISVDDGMLTISAEQEKEKTGDDDSYSRYEYNYNSFSRSFSLPRNVDADAITAKQENGELRLTLPKKEVTSGSGRNITIE